MLRRDPVRQSGMSSIDGTVIIAPLSAHDRLATSARSNRSKTINRQRNLIGKLASPVIRIDCAVMFGLRQ